MGEFDNESIYSLHRSVVEQHMEFLFKGKISDDVVNALLEIVKKKFQEFNIDYSLRKKIYNIAVECLENVSEYTVSDSKKDSIFLIGNLKELFFIGTGNIIKNEFTSELENNIEKINQLDRTELKTLYKETITSQIENDSNEVMLSLVDIALKANNKIEYKIERINDKQDFFSFQIKINTNA